MPSSLSVYRTAELLCIDQPPPEPPMPPSRKPLLTEGPIARTLLLFSLPILGANVLQSLNASVNMVWIGHYLGEAALTAHLATHVGTRRRVLTERGGIGHTEQFLTVKLVAPLAPGRILDLDIAGHDGRRLLAA